MNIGLLLEVLVSSFLLILLLSIFTLHYSSLVELLKNEKESYRILKLLVVSDEYVSKVLAVERLNTLTNNLVDCSKLVCEENVYVRCGSVVCGTKEDKLVILRRAVYEGKEINVEVGIE